MAGSVVIVGGTSGIGLALARRYAADGRHVVITGRDAGRTREVAATIPGSAGVETRAFDLAEPASIGDALAGIDEVDRLVLAAIERDDNAVREYDVTRATRLVVLKLVGYTEVIHVMAPQLGDDASILVFGGLAMMRPYPGSTTITTVNGGVSSMVRSLAVELAPVRVNAIHPGIVGDTPTWASKPPAVLEAVRARTPLGRLVGTEEVVDAATFLLENGAVNGINLPVDGGWLLT
jgi:NAD(P)-dependent dehydrogenase (short-subunit alcohol dehydrogenase family)